jgi:hypothetical protein
LLAGLSPQNLKDKTCPKPEKLFQLSANHPTLWRLFYERINSKKGSVKDLIQNGPEGQTTGEGLLIFPSFRVHHIMLKMAASGNPDLWTEDANKSGCLEL